MRMAELRYLSVTTSMNEQDVRDVMNEQDVRDVWHLTSNAQYERELTQKFQICVLDVS